jgi:hypothetical protein
VHKETRQSIAAFQNKRSVSVTRKVHGIVDIPFYDREFDAVSIAIELALDIPFSNVKTLSA